MSETKQTQANCPVAGVVIQPDAGNDGSELAALSRQALLKEIIERLRSGRTAVASEVTLPDASDIEEAWAEGFEEGYDHVILVLDDLLVKAQRELPDVVNADGRPG